MDKAYESDETGQCTLDFGYIPVVPPKFNRVNPWEYDKAMYRKRNGVERLFRRIKWFLRVFSRFDNLDVMFTGFILFILIVEELRCDNTAKVMNCFISSRIFGWWSSGYGSYPLLLYGCSLRFWKVVNSIARLLKTNNHDW